MPTKTKPFLILDAWRGLACLGVVAYHMAEVMLAQYPQLAHNSVYRLCDIFNLGVQLFFVISGYCIANAMIAASDRGKNFGFFIQARARRIYPTAALAITCGLLFSIAATAMLSHGMVASSSTASKNILHNSFLYFFANYTLTNAIFNQGFVLIQCWTLCYEAAFYLIVGLSMLLVRSRFGNRGALNALHALTAAALLALIVNPHLLHYPLDLWPEFGLGVVVYDLVSSRAAKNVRIWAFVLAAETLALLVLYNTPLGTMGVSSRAQYGVCLAFAAILTACYRYDAILARLPISRALGWVGIFSYSLYLTHTFSIGVINQISKRLHLPESLHYVVFVLVIVGAVAFGRLFFQFCEKPFLSARAKSIIRAVEEPETTDAVAGAAHAAPTAAGAVE